MALDFINEKEAEERKREKRLVHMTNELGRGFVETLKLKTKSEKQQSEFIAKSFLDYVFFEQRKEIAEIRPYHIEHFLLEYAPRKLSLTRDLVSEIPDVIARLIKFLDDNGYLKNTAPILASIKKHAKSFAKTTAAAKKTPAKKDKTMPVPSPAKPTSEPKVGRNDPCPCGSGKKYKKCCGHGK